jgi:hypothetical protein
MEDNGSAGDDYDGNGCDVHSADDFPRDEEM